MFANLLTLNSSQKKIIIRPLYWSQKQLSIILDFIFDNILPSPIRSHHFLSPDILIYRQWLNSAGTGRNGVPPPVFGVPPPEIAVPPPKVVVPPPGNDVPSPLGENH